VGGLRFGHKGYALALWCEAMAALAGGRCNNPDLPQRQALALTVLDPAAYAGAEAYLAEMRRFVAWLKTSRRRPGCEQIRLPGERGFRALREARANGVPVEDRRLTSLHALADALNLRFPPPLG
jgi:LDH2 family malate/lactate/ureidoglycolate dehydrogenase